MDGAVVAWEWAARTVRLNEFCGVFVVRLILFKMGLKC